MKRKLIGCGIGVVLVLALVSASCAGPAAPAGEVWEREFELPWVASFTGGLSVWVIEADLGAELAVEEINRTGGFDRRTVFLARYDCASDPALAVSQIKKAAPGALVILGPHTSTDAAAGGPTAASLKCPWFGGGTTGPSWCIEPENRPWTWMQWLSNEKTGALVGELLMPMLPQVKKVAIMQETKEKSAVGQGAGCWESLKPLGIEIVSETQCTLGDVDFTVQATQSIAANPDAIIIAAYTSEAGGLIKELRKQGWTGIIITPQTCMTPEILRVAGPENMEGVLTAMTYSSKAETPASVKEFTEAFRARHGRDPGAAAATNYDAIMVIRNVFEAEGLTNDPAKLQQERDALVKAMAGKEWEGAYGKISWDADGIMSAKGFPLVWENSELVIFTGF